MRIALLPLDSRPCNRLFPVQLAEINNVKLITPPMEALDNFTTAASFERIESWVKEQSCECEVLVLSIDMLLYGGLLASRTGKPGIDECKRCIRVLKDIKTLNPALKIHAFNVIMRTSISTLNEESKVWWEKINQYSRLTHRVELENTARDRAELEKLIAEIPNEILSDFLRVRERNHEINSACIDLVRDGIIDQLVLLQEDSHQYGIHKNEQRLLKQRIEAYILNDKIQIHNGTDEAGCLLVASSINESLNRTVTIGYEYLVDNRKNFIAMYEDRLFHENLISHARTCGVELDENLNNRDVVLFIYTPKIKQYDACLYEGALPTDFSNEELEAFANRISDAVNSGKKVGLLDITYANGGDGRLLYALSKKINLLDLYGYAAWNTASNSLGTILSQLSLCSGFNSKKNLKFTAGRLLDDYLYQSVVRRRLDQELLHQGHDVWNLKYGRDTADMLLKVYMKESEAVDWLLQGYNLDFSCRLVWPRTFECEIEVGNIAYNGGGELS